MACRRSEQAANSPNYQKVGKTAVHRIVAASAIGRPLAAGEVVHHVDGNHRNNDPANLVVLSSQAEHARIENMQRDPAKRHADAVLRGVKSGESRRRKRDERLAHLASVSMSSNDG